MDKDIEILQDWIARDREMRNNSTQSDYDKFCEEKCEAIEHIICENAQYSEHNRKLEQALIDADRECEEWKKAYELACEVRDDWGGREYSGTEYDNYKDYFLAKAKLREIQDGR